MTQIDGSGVVLPEEIRARMERLEAQRLELVAQVNATMGAIQDCQFWLSRLGLAETTTKPAAAAEPEGDTDGR